MADSSGPLSRRWQCESSFWMSVGDKQNQAWCGNRLRYGMHKHASYCENFADYNENRQQHKFALWAIVLGRRRWIYYMWEWLWIWKQKIYSHASSTKTRKRITQQGVSEWLTNWNTWLGGLFSEQQQQIAVRWIWQADCRLDDTTGFWG